MFSLTNVAISKEDFKKIISDEDIYQYYLGDFEDGSWFSAPWRRDSDPSLRITYYNNQWVWVDFGEDPRDQDAISLIMKYYNISFREALIRGYEDIITNGSNTQKVRSTQQKESKSYCNLRTELYTWELDYWAKANITREDLIHFRVYSGEIRHNGIVWHRSVEKDPLFIYLFNKSIPVYKGYRPNSKTQRNKFYGKNINKHIQGLDLLPATGDVLIITKSYKDVIVWYKLGYPAIAPHSESSFVESDILEDLKKRFKTIIVNYDNDTTGVKKSIEFTDKYDLGYFNLPVQTCCKDPFQFVCEKGYENLEELFLKKLKYYDIK